MRPGEKRSRRLAKRLRQELTRAETLLWWKLRGDAMEGVRFRRQHPVGFYIADFACIAHRLVVEVDGATHSTPDEIAHDRRRDAFMRSRGWRVLRVSNTDVYENLDGVMEAIAASLPPPSHR